MSTTPKIAEAIVSGVAEARAEVTPSIGRVRIAVDLLVASFVPLAVAALLTF